MRRALELLGVAVLAFVSGVALVHLGMLLFVRTGGQTQVPDVVGQDLAVARAALEQAGFTGVEAREANSSDFAAGRVSEQRPDGGTLLRRGRKVWLTVSLGPRRATAPRVAGLSIRQASIALQDEQLESGDIARAHHPEVPRGHVIAQDPPAGQSLSEGQRVDLLLSLGPAPTEWVLPDLTGRPAMEAEIRLERAGLRVGDRTVVLDPAAPAGTVVEQDPPAGSRVAAGQRVDLVVASRR